MIILILYPEINKKLPTSDFDYAIISPSVFTPIALANAHTLAFESTGVWRVHDICSKSGSQCHCRTDEGAPVTRYIFAGGQVQVLDGPYGPTQRDRKRESGRGVLILVSATSATRESPEDHSDQETNDG
jgi:hypothetical protein